MSLIQNLTEGDIDIQAFSLFFNADAAIEVPRRLNLPVQSLSHYEEYLKALKSVYTQTDGMVTVNGVNVKPVTVAVRDAIDAAILGDYKTQLEQQIASVAGGRKSYKTYALMTADKANITANSIVDITNDTAENNGAYNYDGTTFTKSSYDPLTQSKSYTDTAKSSAISTAAADVDKKIEVTNDKSNVVDIRDGDSKSLLIIDKYGEIFPAGLNGESVQSAIHDLDSREMIDHDTSAMAINLKFSDGTTVLSIDKYGDIYATGVDGSIQDALRNQSPPQTQNISSVTIQGEHVVGKALYAELPKGFVADGYQWQRNGVDIEGATNSAYILSAADLYQKITVLANNISGGYEVFDNSKTTIGGIAIGEAGKAGTLYEDYVLSAGDDFTELDIIAPHNPLGRWFTTRTYLAGARGSDSLLGTMYDTDPYHVGYNDSNRGVPVGYDNMYVSDSVITLQSRKASPEEKKHFQGSNRNEVAAMISSVGAFSMYAGDANGGENILEFRVRHSNRDRNPEGWHPTLWTQSSLPSVTYNSDEWDISEGTHGWSYTNYNKWGADGGKIGGSSYGIMRIFDGLWHTVTAIFSHSKYELYIDGVFNQEVLIDTNSVNEPAYALVSSHIYNGTFGFDTYDKEQWNALTKGAQQEVDFIRLWRKAGKSHIKPLVTIPPINIAYGETGTITLPSKMALWGREDVLEHVQTVMTEENEPAGHHTQAYNSLPSFITYDTLTRTATINTAGQKSGRLNFVIYGYLQDGSTCEPARTYANVAPRIDVTTINMTVNSAYDLYAKCDCGVLVTDGIKRTKVINVSGLPINASYNDNTGFIYANDAAHGTYALIVQCINSVGQSTTKTINLIIA